MIDLHSKENTRIKPLFIGFFLSLVCTAGAYGVAFFRVSSEALFFAAIACLGVIQTFLQGIFFFRLNTEKKPRWNLLMFILMSFVIFCIIGGSIWIMNNLRHYTGYKAG